MRKAERSGDPVLQCLRNEPGGGQECDPSGVREVRQPSRDRDQVLYHLRRARAGRTIAARCAGFAPGAGRSSSAGRHCSGFSWRRTLHEVRRDAVARREHLHCLWSARSLGSVGRSACAPGSAACGCPAGAGCHCSGLSWRRTLHQVRCDAAAGREVLHRMWGACQIGSAGAPAAPPPAAAPAAGLSVCHDMRGDHLAGRALLQRLPGSHLRAISRAGGHPGSISRAGAHARAFCCRAPGQTRSRGPGDRHRPARADRRRDSAGGCGTSGTTSRNCRPPPRRPRFRSLRSRLWRHNPRRPCRCPRPFRPRSPGPARSRPPPGRRSRPRSPASRPLRWRRRVQCRLHGAERRPLHPPASRAPEAAVPPREPEAATPLEPPEPVPAPVPPPRTEIPRPAPAAPPAAPSGPVYTGPPSGTILWSGQLQKNGMLTIDGGQASTGSLNGELPGVPVMIDIQPSDVGMAEAPSPANGWKRMVLRSRVNRRTVVTIQWTVLR